MAKATKIKNYTKFSSTPANVIDNKIKILKKLEENDIWKNNYDVTKDTFTWENLKKYNKNIKKMDEALGSNSTKPLFDFKSIDNTSSEFKIDNATKLKTKITNILKKINDSANKLKMFTGPASSTGPAPTLIITDPEISTIINNNDTGLGFKTIPFEADNITKLEERATKCYKLEVEYFTKHIEIYYCSLMALKILKFIKYTIELYASLRVLNLKECPKNVTIRMPPSTDILGIGTIQQDALDTLKNLPQDIVETTFTETARSGGGTTRFLSLDNKKLKEHFKTKYDGIMFTEINERNDGHIDAVNTSDFIDTTIASWEKSIKQFEQNINAQLTGTNSIIIDVKQWAKKGKLFERDEIFNKLNDDTVYKETTVWPEDISDLSTSDDITNFYESYFMKCYIFEYLYIVKHFELINMVRMVNLLQIYYETTVVILILYLRALDEFKCTGTPAYIQLLGKITDYGKLIGDQATNVSGIFADNFIKKMQQGGQSGGDGDDDIELVMFKLRSKINDLIENRSSIEKANEKNENEKFNKPFQGSVNKIMAYIFGETNTSTRGFSKQEGGLNVQPTYIPNHVDDDTGKVTDRWNNDLAQEFAINNSMANLKHVIESYLQKDEEALALQDTTDITKSIEGLTLDSGSNINGIKKKIYNFRTKNQIQENENDPLKDKLKKKVVELVKAESAAANALISQANTLISQANPLISEDNDLNTGSTNGLKNILSKLKKKQTNIGKIPHDMTVGTTAADTATNIDNQINLINTKIHGTELAIKLRKINDKQNDFTNKLNSDALSEDDVNTLKNEYLNWADPNITGDDKAPVPDGDNEKTAIEDAIKTYKSVINTNSNEKIKEINTKIEQSKESAQAITTITDLVNKLNDTGTEATLKTALLKNLPNLLTTLIESSESIIDTGVKVRKITQILDEQIDVLIGITGDLKNSFITKLTEFKNEQIGKLINDKFPTQAGGIDEKFKNINKMELSCKNSDEILRTTFSNMNALLMNLKDTQTALRDNNNNNDDVDNIITYFDTLLDPTVPDDESDIDSKYSLSNETFRDALEFIKLNYLRFNYSVKLFENEDETAALKYITKVKNDLTNYRDKCIPPDKIQNLAENLSTKIFAKINQNVLGMADVNVVIRVANKDKLKPIFKPTNGGNVTFTCPDTDKCKDASHPDVLIGTHMNRDKYSFESLEQYKDLQKTGVLLNNTDDESTPKSECFKVGTLFADSDDKKNKYGPFTKIYMNQTTPNIYANTIKSGGYIDDLVSTNSNIVIFGFGFSGSGKTFTLIDKGNPNNLLSLILKGIKDTSKGSSIEYEIFELYLLNQLKIVKTEDGSTKHSSIYEKIRTLDTYKNTYKKKKIEKKN